MNKPVSSVLPAAWQGWVWQGGESAQHLRQTTINAMPLQPGEVLVQNAAIGLNPVDWKVLDSQTGLVPGVDGAGTVVAVGRGVAQSWLGKRVAYHQNLRAAGSFAGYTPLAADVLMQLPDALEFAQAAAFPCPGLTAWQALEKLPTQPGAELLIAGAGGSVGHYLVQLAVARGFRVTAMCSERHWSRLSELGAQRCLTNREQIATPADSPRYFALIDCVGAEHARALADLLKANGHLVCIQGRVEVWPCTPFGRALSMHEVALGALHQHGDASDWQKLTASGEQLLQQIASGTLKQETLLHFSFAQLPQQLDALKHRNFSGKQIILL